MEWARRKVFHGWISAPHRKILRSIKMVFDDIWHLTWDSFCHSCGEFWQLARQTRDTDTTDTVDTPVHVSYCLIHDLLCKRLGSKVSNFTRSNAVFFFVASTNFRVWLFSHLNFCFKPCRRLNGSQEMLLGLFLWLDDKQCSIFEFLSCFPPFLLPSPVPLLPPVLLGSRPPFPPPSTIYLFQSNRSPWSQI